MIELNLLPDVKLQYVHAQKQRRRVISIVSIGGIAAVGLVVVFALYVYAVQPVRGLVTDNAIKDANKQLSAIPDLNNYLTLQQQLDALPALHASKPIYSRIISYLPTLNPSAPNSVHITRLAIDTTIDAHTIKLDAYAQTYTAATVFESTLKSAQFTYTNGATTQTTPLFKSADITNTAIGQDSNGNPVTTFTVTLTVADPIFAFSSTNTGISVPNKNATNSAAGVPSEVFASTGGQ
jgi:Tfp pilus assembly protein PilN